MRRAVLLSLLLPLPAVPARADPFILITGGSLDMFPLEQKPMGKRASVTVSDVNGDPPPRSRDGLRSSGLSSRPIVRSRARSTR